MPTLCWPTGGCDLIMSSEHLELARKEFRDALVEVRDAATGATGIGNCQTWVQGRWPEHGLPDG